MPSTTGTVENFVYERSGVFDMRVTVTNSQGVSASAVKTVTITNLTGVWDLTCVNPNTFYGAPSLFVVTLAQTGTQLSGTITGTSSGVGVVSNSTWTQSFDRGSAYSDYEDPQYGQNAVKRYFGFGVESVHNPWGAWTEDLYFNLELNETGMLATSHRDINLCGPVRAYRR